MSGSYHAKLYIYNFPANVANADAILFQIRILVIDVKITFTIFMFYADESMSLYGNEFEYFVVTRYYFYLILLY